MKAFDAEYENCAHKADEFMKDKSAELLFGDYLALRTEQFKACAEKRPAVTLKELRALPAEELDKRLELNFED